VILAKSAIKATPIYPMMTEVGLRLALIKFKKWSENLFREKPIMK